MYYNLVMSTQHAGHQHAATNYLRQEIAFLEMRLLEMGDRGDCAYEHALSKAYQVLLQERKQQLARL
jgi:hypothetical protein